MWSGIQGVRRVACSLWDEILDTGWDFTDLRFLHERSECLVDNRLVQSNNQRVTSISDRYCRIDPGQCAIKSDDPRILRGNIGTKCRRSPSRLHEGSI